MNSKSRLLDCALRVTAAALLLAVSPALASNMENLKGADRDPSKVNSMRRTSAAERVEAANRAAERRKQAEAQGLVQPKEKQRVRVPAEVQQREERVAPRNGPPKQRLDMKRFRNSEPRPQGIPTGPGKAGGEGHRHGAVNAGGGSGLQAALHSLTQLAMAQVGTPDYYAVPNFATSKWAIAHCAGPGSNSAELCQKDSDCTGYLPPYTVGPNVFPTAATCTGPVVPGTGIKKFVDTLAPLCPFGTNNLGNCIPVAEPNTTKFPGSEYYELGLKDYTTRFHSDLGTGTRVRGYYQKNAGVGSPAGQNSYLGPLILAKTNVPVRIHFSNDLASSAVGGNLFIPVDTTLSGTGIGPDGSRYSENRAAIHLHGGNTPWISDGTQHQWTVPSAETNAITLRKGLAVAYVPDMWYLPDGTLIDACKGQLTCAVAGATNNPGDGKLTYYYTNQQSGRLMFYHDHAYGITRLNVYAGEAAGYLLVNPDDENRLAAVGTPGTVGTTADLAHMIPLVIQDKTFVPPAYQLSQQDPTWDEAKWSGENGLWMPHVYVPNQWPGNPDLSSMNPVGRWNYGPWFWPVQTTLTEVDQAGVAHPRPTTVPCTTVAAVTDENPNGDTRCPSTPLPSLAPEAFLDTPVINGTAYPTVNLEPRAYRFHVLNAAGERNFNLSFFVADSTGTEVAMVPAREHTINEATMPLCAETAPISRVTGTPNGPDLATPTCWPLEWPTDMRQGGVPDPTFVGPKWIQIGAEGGLLPAPAVIPPRPTVFEMSKLNIVVFNVLSKSLFLGPAERADVVVDFSAYAGKTLILYSDAPAPVPAGDPRQDPFTGGPDFSESGGSPTPLPGYGPNVRTIMQVKVAATPVAPYTALPSSYDADVSVALANSFRLSQPAPIVPESAYNPVYNPATPFNDTYLTIGAQELTFTPVGEAGSMSVTLGSKALHELFTPTYGRMDSLLAVEIPNTNWLNQTTIPFFNFDPPTEYLPNDQIQLWKVTHNGVDTHTIHFHLFNVQIVNRVGWDGAIRAPDANEMGWKEAVRMNPLEDIIVALRPVVQTLPWPLPDMWRPLDVDRPVGTNVGEQFTGVDIYGLPMPTANKLTNFGQEYVWHCHLLGHEEEDMLRAEVLVAPPEMPTGLTVTPGNGNTIALTWHDPSKSALTFTVQRDTSPSFANPVTFSVPKGATQPGPVSYGDTAEAQDGTTYYYRVRAEKSLLSTAERPDTASPGKLYTATSAWSAIGQGAASPNAILDRATLAFGTQATGTPSSAQNVVLRNNGTATLTVVSLTLTGLNPGNYARTSDCGATLAPAASCTIGVTFTPLTGGNHPASLTVSTNATNTGTLVVNLTGTGTGPVASMTPAALTYAPQGQLSPSVSQLITLVNAGSGPLAINSATVTGAQAGDFTFTTTCGTIPTTLAAAASCNIDVRFTPTAAGARTASLVVTTDDPVHATLTTTLSGSGIEKATSVTLTPDQPSPHTNGLAVKFTAKGFGPMVLDTSVPPKLVPAIPPSAWQYQFSVDSGTGATVVQPWNANATWILPSLSLSGTYVVTVAVRTSTASAGDATSLPVNYVVTNASPTNATLTSNLASPQAPGTAVTFSAACVGSPACQYQFTSTINGTTTVVQPWSTVSNWTMPSTTLAGTYTIAVSVRASLASTGDATTSRVFQIALTPATGITLTPSVVSPAGIGQSVTWTALATGGTGAYQFEFWTNTGGIWTLRQAYSSASTWVMPGTFPVGPVTVHARVRTNPTVPYDAFLNVAYQVGSLPATGVTLTPSVTSPATVGTAVTFTAQGVGGTGTYNYSFWIQSKGIWSEVQTYGTSNTWTLPAWASTGGYTIQTRVRTNSTVVYDAFLNLTYQVGNLPATGVTLTSSVASPAPAGSSPTFTALGVGGTGAYEYEFWTLQNGIWSIRQSYSVLNFWTMPADSLGLYTVQVRVRTNPTSTYDAYTVISNYRVGNLPAIGVTLELNATSPRTVGTPVAVIAKPSGGTAGTYLYEFWTNLNSIWTMQRTYSTQATWNWTGTTAGTYTLLVKVKTNAIAANPDVTASVPFVLQ